MAFGESRTELLAWLNSTLELQYKKVEECGSGAAFCQLLDCVYGGVPMNKVNFRASSEYDYRQNWKVLQAQFTKHNITKIIDVEKLMKCRLQDNLELLQWFKKLWVDNRANTEYDPVKRRGSHVNSANNSFNATPKRKAVAPLTGQLRNSSLLVRGTLLTSRVSSLALQKSSRVESHVPKTPTVQEQLANALAEIDEYRVASETLETERNFYFNKLREIEILVQNIGDLVEKNDIDKLKELTVMDLTRQVQSILYSTEEGFQVMEDGEVGDILDDECF